MIVTGIEITHYHYCPRSARHVANVCMTLKDRIVTLFCQLEMPENETPADRARAFIGDATRQMCRMPEIRSGRDKLEFSDRVAKPPLPTLA